MKLRYLVIGLLIGLLIGAVPAYAIIFTFGGGGGAAGADQNLFETIDAPSGTDPVADISTDTLQILCDDGVTCTGSAAADSVEWDVTIQTTGADADSATTQSDSGLEFVSNELVLLRGCTDNELLKWDETQDDWNCEADVDTDTQLTQEQVEDFAGALVTDGTGTHTDITITYQDATGDVDFVVDTLPNLTGTLDVNSGGTGASSFTDGGILLGSGTGAITALGVATNGQIPIGDGTTDPVLAAIAGTTNQVTVTNGAGTITLSTPQDIHTGASPTFATLNLTGAAPATPVADRVYTDSIVKAWVRFDGTGAVSIDDDLNVSSITDNGTGDYTINFATSLGDANYAISAITSTDGDASTFGTVSVDSATAPTASAVGIFTHAFNDTATDFPIVMAIVID